MLTETQSEGMDYVEYLAWARASKEAASATIGRNLKIGMRVWCEGDWRTITSIRKYYEHRTEVSCGEDYCVCVLVNKYVPTLAY